MALTAENELLATDDVRLAESLRRADAFAEMAEVLRSVERRSSVPDVRWMAQVAAEELAGAARFERRICVDQHQVQPIRRPTAQS